MDGGTGEKVLAPAPAQSRTSGIMVPIDLGKHGRRLPGTAMG